MNKWCKIYLIPLLGVLTLVFSCREKPDPPTYYIPDAYKSYIAFQPGTYWVYEDSVSGVLDSVVVVNFYHSLSEILGEKEEIDYCAESISTEYFSYFKSQKGFVQSTVNCVNMSGGENCCLTSRRTDAAGEGDRFLLAQYPFEIGSLPDGTGQIVEIYGDYTIDSISYGTTIKTLVPSDYTQYGYSSYYYFSRNLGIVRLETLNNLGVWRIWKLKRYHAVR
jgi:hypothetical protein